MITQNARSCTHLVTKNAVSLIVSGPTLTCPCSMNVTAALMVSAIWARTKTTGNRRRQKEDAVTLLANANDALVGTSPRL